MADSPAPESEVSKDMHMMYWHLAAIIILLIIMGVMIAGRDNDFRQGYSACLTDVAGK